MASQNTQYIQGPKWIGLKMQTYTSGSKTGGKRQNSYSMQYSFTSEIRRQKFVSLWAGKEARTYLSMVDQDKKDSLKTMLDILKDWTRPRPDEVAAFTQLSIKVTRLYLLISKR